MNSQLRKRTAVIAALLRAGRPDLADAVVASAYWARQYRGLKQQAETLQKRLRFFAHENEKVQGRSSLVYRSLMDASAAVDQVLNRIKILQQGIGLETDRPGRAA